MCFEGTASYLDHNVRLRPGQCSNSSRLKLGVASLGADMVVPTPYMPVLGQLLAAEHCLPVKALAFTGKCG